MNLMNANEWISVKDRLPQNEQAVLCYGHYSYDQEDFEIDAEIYHAIYLSIGYWEVVNQMTCIMQVTHWMPLPEKPKDK